MRRTLTAIFAASAALALPAAAQALPTGNLLQNPGAEMPPSTGLLDEAQPIPGWTWSPQDPHLRVVDEEPNDGATGFIKDSERPAEAGCRLFVGPNNPSDGDDATANGYTGYTAYQDVPVTDDMIGQTVRIGGLASKYSNMSQEFNDDSAYVTVFFLKPNGDPISSISSGNESQPNPGNSGATITLAEKTATVPVGAATMRFYITSYAVFGMGPHGYTNASIDNAYLTFDATAPAAAPAGCGAPSVELGPVTNITQTSATVSGTLDPRGEASAWSLRVATTPDATGGTVAGAYDVTTAQSVSGDAVGLEPGTKYYYVLEAVSYPADSGPGSAYATSTTTHGEFTTAAPAVTQQPTPQPQPQPQPQADPFAKPLSVTLESFKQKRSKVLVSGFEFKMKTNHPGDFKAQVYVRDVKNKAKKYPCGSQFKENFLGAYDIVGRSYQANGVSATSKCSAQLRAKSYKKRVGRKSRKVTVSSNTMLVVWSFVDTRGKKATGTFSYVIRK